MIYLDYAGSTPVLPDLMKHYILASQKFWGNPSAVHPIGRLAKLELELSRLKIFQTLQISRNEYDIVFTSSITEANFLALQAFTTKNNQPENKVLYSVLEHDSVLQNIQQSGSVDILKANQFDKNSKLQIEITEDGFLSLTDLENKITDEIKLVCINTINNEIGTIQPILEIRKIVDKVNLKRKEQGIAKLYIFSDGAQTGNWINLKSLVQNVDLLSLSSSKIYAPKGASCLIYKKDINLVPILKGGKQENGIRAGTENIPAISTLALALETAQQSLEENCTKALNLRDYIQQKLADLNFGIQVNGFYEQGNRTKRVANNLNIFIPNFDTQELLTALSLKNICLSSGSNCRSGALKNSPLFDRLSQYRNQENAVKSEDGANLRISLGVITTQEEIDEFLIILQQVLQNLS